MGRACSINGIDKKGFNILVRNLERKRKTTLVDSRIILG
jgi:hypothetical protein